MVASKLAICIRTDYYERETDEAEPKEEKKEERNKYGKLFFEQLDKKRVKLNENNASKHTKGGKGIKVEKRKKLKN